MDPFRVWSTYLTDTGLGRLPTGSQQYLAEEYRVQRALMLIFVSLVYLTLRLCEGEAQSTPRAFS